MKTMLSAATLAVLRAASSSVAQLRAVLLPLALATGTAEAISASVVEFKSATYEVSELGGGWYGETITLTCTPPPPTDQGIRVEFRVIPETATWNSDFRVQGDLVGDPNGRTFPAYFQPGAHENHIPFSVVDDGLPETNETVRLEIVSVGNGATIGPQAAATLTIRNAGPHLALGGQYTGGLEGGALGFSLSRRGDTNVAVSVDYATTTNGTAIPGADFVPASGRLEFAPGEQHKSILVELPDNGAVHAPGSKTVVLQLSRPTGATLDPTPLVGSIADDEIPATVDLSFHPDLGLGRWPGLTAVAIDNDGGILVARRELFSDDRQVSLLRLQADGTADPRFRPMNLGVIRQIMPAQDGRILIVSSIGDPDPREDGPAVLVRLFADGTVDTGFGTAGRVDLPAETGVLLQWNGKIVRFGIRLFELDSPTIRRLNLDGSEDSAFAANTSALPRLWISQVAEHRDGKLLVLGRQPEPQPHGISTILRLNPDGTKDAGFRHWLAGEMSSLLALSDGKILVHVNGGEGDLAGRRIVRLLPDGELDRSFPDWGVEWFIPEHGTPPYPRFFAELNGRVYFTRTGHEVLRTKRDGLPDPGFAVWSYSDDDPVRAAASGGTLLCWSARESFVNGLARLLARIVLDDEPLPAFALASQPTFENDFVWGTWRHPRVALETNGAARITVRRLGDVSAQATVRFATQDRTARAGEHYVKTEGTLVFAPLEHEKAITVPLIQDKVFRGAPEFLLNLSDPSIPAQLDQPARVSIYDAEPGLIWGPVFTGEDGSLRIEYDVTSQVLVKRSQIWFFSATLDVPIESSEDLQHWSLVPPEQRGGWYPVRITPQGVFPSSFLPPYVLIPPGETRRFFRVRIEE